MVYSPCYLLCKNEHHKFPTSSTRATHDGDINDRAMLCNEGYYPPSHIKAGPAGSVGAFVSVKAAAAAVAYLADWILLARQERAGL